MATLHVRNVPEDLYAQLNRFAASNNQSLSAEVVALLTQAAEIRERRNNLKSVLSNLRRRRFMPPASVPGSASLLREDRDR